MHTITCSNKHVDVIIRDGGFGRELITLPALNLVLKSFNLLTYFYYDPCLKAKDRTRGNIKLVLLN